jgi:hypothetical protein
MSKTFCPIPWIFQAIRNNGDVRICCQANVTKNQGVVRHQDGTSFNAKVDNLEDARNADLMKQVRLNMLNDEWSEECTRCMTEEVNGLNSRRQYELENWNFSIDDAKLITDSVGAISNQKLKYYDLRFGNMCNLACRMCGPTDSHTWYEQWTEYHKTDGYDDTHGRVTLTRNDKGRLSTTDYDWHSSDSFWEQLEKNIPTMEHVYMAGGEPMMIERHYEFLQRCIDLGYSKNIILEYNTNMTNLPDRVLKMWTKFKQVRVGASIDGMGAVIEYQRWPLKWNHVLKNLKKLDDYAEKNSNILPWLAYTVTVYNVWHTPEFMWWKLKESGFKKINSTKKRPVITHHIAHGPKRTNLKLLPNYKKDEIKSYYLDWIEKFKQDNEISEDIKNNAVSILESIIKFMYSGSFLENFEEFKNFTNYLDQARKQSIVEVVPQYKDFFKGP